MLYSNKVLFKSICPGLYLVLNGMFVSLKCNGLHLFFSVECCYQAPIFIAILFKVFQSLFLLLSAVTLWLTASSQWMSLYHPFLHTFKDILVSDHRVTKRHIRNWANTDSSKMRMSDWLSVSVCPGAQNGVSLIRDRRFGGVPYLDSDSLGI